MELLLRQMIDLRLQQLQRPGTEDPIQCPPLSHTHESSVCFDAGIGSHNRHQWYELRSISDFCNSPQAYREA